VSLGTAALLVVGGGAALLLGWTIPTVDRFAISGRRGGGGSVSVVIPARDEAASLPDLLTSLATQTEPPREILVVDDGSTDATASLAAAAGATVLAASDPPPGWAGKPWACHLGAEAASGEHLVLLDADTRLAPDGLAELLAAHAHLCRHGLLSVQPYHRVERPHEQLSLFANVVPVLASGLGRRRDRARRTVAFGPCLVTRATDLAAVGGFAAVRGEVLEDVALARAYAAAGRPVRCLAGGSAVSFRMYPGGLRSLVEGWTKNLAGGAGRAPRLPVLGAGLWVAALAALTVEAVVRPSPLVGLAWVVATLQLAWLARRLGSFSPWAIVLFPIPLAAFVALFVRSVVHRSVRRRVRWRGRDLPVRR
jgi:hypothetical protein